VRVVPLFVPEDGIDGSVELEPLVPLRPLVELLLPELPELDPLIPLLGYVTEAPPVP